MLTLTEAQALNKGEYLIDIHNKRWKITSVTLWKKSPQRVRIGLQHGLYVHDSLTEVDFHDGECGWVTRQEVK